MNRKIALSGFSILSAVVLLTGSAFAAFNVQATAPSGTFSSSNPVLQICNDNGANSPINCGTSINSPIALANLIPGTPQTFVFWLNNIGPDAMSPLNAVFANPSGTGAGNGNLETALNVGLTCTNSAGSVVSTSFVNWEGAGQTFVSGSIPGNTDTKCSMTVGIPSGNTTVINQSLGFNATFNGSVGN